jgi:hypothetical protein
MPDEHNLFGGEAAAEDKSVARVEPFEPRLTPAPQPAPQKSDFKVRAKALIDEHFPAMDAKGVEAHQPMRDFCLKVLDIL